MSFAWNALPAEIWLSGILPELPPASLAQLCATCSVFLAMGRPILFRTVVLRSERNKLPNPAIEPVLALLERNTELARRVHALVLDATSAPDRAARNPCLIHAPSLSNMISLKRLTILESIELTAGRGDIQRFIDIIHERQLDELAFPSVFVRPFLLPLQESQQEKLGNPKRLVFYLAADRHDLLAPVMTRIFTAAQPTLTSLSIRAPTTTLMHLFALRFPNLRSLEATVFVEGANGTTPAGFYEFLCAHDTLEELFLTPPTFWNWERQTMRDDGGLSLSETFTVPPTFLPNLRVLRASFQTLEALGRSRVESLQKITSLTVTNLPFVEPTSTADGVAAYRRALQAVRDTQKTLPSLLEFELDLFFWYYFGTQAVLSEFAERIAALAGETLELFGGLPMMDAFPGPAFPRLRRILCPQQSYEEDWDAEGVSSLFGSCQSLSEVVVIRALSSAEQRKAGNGKRHSKNVFSKPET
ncbi:BHLH domain-containing protein [Mycena kentingensis (nom. inval.)]|nr:BHLH domain-containing protein [Mycena kentingensis (nom. inval.)]